MDKKQYELVIKLTENSQNLTDLFYRISALLVLGRGEEALSCLLANRKILEKRLSVLIKIHIELLCLLGKFDDAFLEYNYYQNLPYESQEVEELLQKIPKYIREEEKKSLQTVKISDEDLKKLLYSNKVEDVVPALDVVKERDINVFLSTLIDLMNNHQNQTVRSFCLLILVNKEIDRDLNFNHLGEIIEVNPSKLVPPFTGEKFNYFCKKMEIEFRNYSLLETALSIHASFVIYNYPVNVDIYDDRIIIALYEIACEFLKTSPTKSIEERCKDKNVDLKETLELKKRIEESTNNF